MISCGRELCFVRIYNDYTEYEIEKSGDVKFFNEHGIQVEKDDTQIIPLSQIQFEKFDFASLVKKVLDLDVKF